MSHHHAELCTTNILRSGRGKRLGARSLINSTAIHQPFQSTRIHKSMNTGSSSNSSSSTYQQHVMPPATNTAVRHNDLSYMLPAYSCPVPSNTADDNYNSSTVHSMMPRHESVVTQAPILSSATNQSNVAEPPIVVSITNDLIVSIQLNRTLHTVQLLPSNNKQSRGKKRRCNELHISSVRRSSRTNHTVSRQPQMLNRIHPSMKLIEDMVGGSSVDGTAQLDTRINNKYQSTGQRQSIQLSPHSSDTISDTPFNTDSITAIISTPTSKRNSCRSIHTVPPSSTATYHRNKSTRTSNHVPDTNKTNRAKHKQSRQLHSSQAMSAAKTTVSSDVVVTDIPVLNNDTPSLPPIKSVNKQCMFDNTQSNHKTRPNRQDKHNKPRHNHDNDDYESNEKPLIAALPQTSSSTTTRPSRSTRNKLVSYVFEDKQDYEFVTCKWFKTSELQPFHVELNIFTHILIELHSHLINDEIIGFMSGVYNIDQKLITVNNAYPVKQIETADNQYNAEMDPGDMFSTIELIESQQSNYVCGWYHSHPKFSNHPSVLDVDMHTQLQSMFYEKYSSPYIAAICTTYNDQKSLLKKNTCDTKYFYTVRDKHDCLPYELWYDTVNTYTQQYINDELLKLKQSAAALYPRYVDHPNRVQFNSTVKVGGVTMTIYNKLKQVILNRLNVIVTMNDTQKNIYIDELLQPLTEWR